MNRLSTLLRHATSRHDIVLAVMLMVAIGMLILPMPTLAIDFFIAINLTFSVVLIATIIYIRDPLELAAFPSILLITTLYRLALTVSTSRLILLQHDAGHIVYAFGNFVVGGNLAVGIIVYAIVTIVQFIVITKGAERVAEVSARFTLDGMPGKQMSIDNDLRTGQIDAAESKRLRQIVQKESQLFGAMDGAMKFVKGDAIASIVVILINLIGGVIIGVLQENLPLVDALHTYSILSVGDGLVAQIPAIVISVAAGLVVTRIPGDARSNLADDLAKQLSAHPIALYIAAGALILVGFLPGFPFFVFAMISVAIAGIAWRLKHRNDAGRSTKSGDDGDEESRMHSGVEPLALRLGAKAARIDKLSVLLDTLRWQKFVELGLTLKPFSYEVDAKLPAHTVQITLYGEVTCTMALPVGECLLARGRRGAVSIIREEAIDNGRNLFWITPEVAAEVSALDVPVAEDEQRITYLLSGVIDHHAREFIGIQETHFLMSSLEKTFPELVREVQRQLPIAKVSEVLQRLVAEGVSIRNLRTVFEALVEWAPREKDGIMLTEYVRLALRRMIVNRWRGGRGTLGVWVVGKSIENLLRDSVRQTAAGAYSALTPRENEEIIESVRRVVLSSEGDGVLVTAIDTRRFLRKLIERDMYWLAVLSMPEVGDERTEVLGSVELVSAFDENI
ncbi:type III secretion system export apparatus subunit SctV [Burkholderia sp. Bp8986]|uniref:type III secretion system export apparatus subunit SctV n=1 Tax=Burkholderia sp. Bp8986 TaxID=2184550 RepID=UPI000F5989F7|nr:type III secretion system export apparatus subunit SctV [Burkholderia sp. Bp8986]RQS44928.1 EscV/YscV/HrcV family type III secretion system export apparatus protein [Burkholderia sp. Bp8986]